jgi:hypothetical protein
MIKYTLLLLLFFSINLYSQDKSTLDNYYRSGVNALTDKTVSYYSAYSDSVLSNLDSSYDYLTGSYYQYFKDSVYTIFRSSLNETGRESLREMGAYILSQFMEYHKNTVSSLKDEFAGFYTQLDRTRLNNINCVDCVNKKGYDMALDNYSYLLDSLGDDFQDRIDNLADLCDSLLTDSLLGCEDTLDGFTDYLIENEPGGVTSSFSGSENGNPYESDVSELDIDMYYTSHESYRGRDNGIVEDSFSPSVTYTHSSGLGVFAGAKWLNKDKYPLDAFSIGGSYDFQISRFFAGSFSYSHYWFKDSSALVRADLNNNLEGNLYLSTNHFNSALAVDYDFGGSYSEFTTTLSGSLPFTISERFLSGNLSAEPGLSMVFGRQSSGLIQQRITRKMKMGNVTSTSLAASSIFGIMDYELSLPFTLEYQHLIINPAVTYIYPVNVLDASTNHGYFNISLDLTVPIRFYK